MSRKVLLGAMVLVAGAALVDLGFWMGEPSLERIGNVGMILSGVGLAYLPAALGGATPLPGRLLYWSGVALASLIDVPAVLDPADLRAGRALGFPAMILLSAGLLLIRQRTTAPGLLLAAGWFFLQLGPNVVLFIIPNDRPSFVLQVVGVSVGLGVAASTRRLNRAAAPSRAAALATTSGLAR